MTSSSPERCARLKTLGADETIDYNAVPEWNTAVRRLTGGMGADLTIEIGGAKTVDRSLAATRVGGRLALVGLLTGIPNTTSSMFASSVEIVPLRIGSRADFEDMNRAIAFHKLRPVIDRRYTFKQLPEALKHPTCRAENTSARSSDLGSSELSPSERRVTAAAGPRLRGATRRGARFRKLTTFVNES